MVNSEYNNVFLADSTILFWARRKDNTEIAENEWDLAIKAMFADPPKDNPDEGVLKAKGLFQSISSGELHTEDDERFFILGLAPNSARLSVRMWKTGTLREISGKFCDYFNDLEMIRSPKDPETLPLSRILRATAFEYKMDNVLPNLAGAVVSSVIDGTPLPATLMQQVIRRIRAEQNVSRVRAAILKAYFNRLSRLNRKDLKEVTMSLDRNNKDIAYRLGRLFAVLEKIQEEANPGINATIRDRFYASMSSNPSVVFPILMRLKNHHLGNIENPGRKINFEREIGQILDEVSIESMPRNLSLEKQGYFAIGYYHQRQDFFIKKTKESENNNEGGNKDA
jgi:CRISPR-associated protein Csd1